MKPGDVVELTNNFGMVGRIGARAVVISIDRDFIRVKWLKGVGNCNYGRYLKNRFKKLSLFYSIVQFLNNKLKTKFS